MKKLLLSILGLTTIFSFGNFNNKAVQTKASDVIESNNYIMIGADETDTAWITKKNKQKQDKDEAKNPIVFFNANPKFEIATIKRINYRVSDSSGKTLDGSVSDSTNHEMMFYYDHSWIPAPTTWRISQTDVSYVNNLFVQTRYKSNEATHFGFSAHTKRLLITFPELGKTRIIKDLYSAIGEYGHNLTDRVLWEYKTSKAGYKSYNDFNRDKNNPNYQYYLVLPLETVSNVKVEYLSLEAYDINGNRITDAIDIDDVNNFNPNPNDPNSTPLQNVSKFSFTKKDGILTSAPAVYFPGSNKFRIVAFQMTKYEATENKDIYLFAGDLIGKKLIELKDGISKEWKITTLERRYISYDFIGRNNSLLIDIPTEITDTNIDIYYEKITEENLVPFALNLTDVNGNYGILGQLPEEKDPNGGSDIWSWFKNLFKFDTNLGIFGSIKNTLGTLLLGTIVLFVAVLLFRLLRRPR